MTQSDDPLPLTPIPMKSPDNQTEVVNALQSNGLRLQEDIEALSNFFEDTIENADLHRPPEISRRRWKKWKGKRTRVLAKGNYCRDRFQAVIQRRPPVDELTHEYVREASDAYYWLHRYWSKGLKYQSPNKLWRWHNHQPPRMYETKATWALRGHYYEYENTTNQTPSDFLSYRSLLSMISAVRPRLITAYDNASTAMSCSPLQLAPSDSAPELAVWELGTDGKLASAHDISEFQKPGSCESAVGTCGSRTCIAYNLMPRTFTIFLKSVVNGTGIPGLVNAEGFKGSECEARASCTLFPKGASRQAILCKKKNRDLPNKEGKEPGVHTKNAANCSLFCFRGQKDRMADPLQQTQDTTNPNPVDPVNPPLPPHPIINRPHPIVNRLPPIVDYPTAENTTNVERLEAMNTNGLRLMSDIRALNDHIRLTLERIKRPSGISKPQWRRWKRKRTRLYNKGQNASHSFEDLIATRPQNDANITKPFVKKVISAYKKLHHYWSKGLLAQDEGPEWQWNNQATPRKRITHWTPNDLERSKAKP
ncbi:hypothetical protein BJ508DRAFT_308159 [Ascobolus immersus RN42]|uniref:Uncharacterized protein n=1 Tax=Ascobolus immersus RN42 TaxID=1160509 RepID=A0A3N4I6F0_ASCIM|nr:hypothetical protein BJ508DRAFT_308159 [Ascobolus immersus RN42]